MIAAQCDVFEAGSRKWKICRNEAGLPIHKTNAYLRQWGLSPLFEQQTESVPEMDSIPELIFHGYSVSDGPETTRNKLYGPGTELLKIYEAAGVPSCDACKELAQQMNNWGVEECRKKLDEIVADILPRAKEWVDSQYPWVTKLLPDAIEEFAIAKRIRSDVTRAIDDCEKTIAERRSKRLNIFTGEKVTGCSACGNKGSATPRTKPANAQTNPRRRGPFTMGTGPKRFITLEQYTADVRKLVAMVPHDIDAVAGVARSGLYPASMIAMWLHKPMFIVSQAKGEIVEAGNGWRLGRGHIHIPPGHGKVLVVDDTVMTGGSQQILRRVIGNKFKETIYATVYCNPLANLAKPDIHAVDLEWPHILEWNLFNSVISHSIAVDFDGILCHDCKPEDDDDGPRYLDFIDNAIPLYLPRKEPLSLIVTARIEKYRGPTEAWLSRHGVRFKKLIMHPAASTRERERDDIAAYKAKHFEAWAKSHRPAPGPIMFIESDDRQARRIATITGRMSVCPATAGVY